MELCGSMVMLEAKQSAPRQATSPPSAARQAIASEVSRMRAFSYLCEDSRGSLGQIDQSIEPIYCSCALILGLLEIPGRG